MKTNIFLMVLLCIILPISVTATTIHALSPTVGYQDMNGMEVNVIFDDQSYEHRIWSVNNNQSGVWGTDWSLTFSGNDTYPMPTINTWNFSSTNEHSIYSIEILALPGHTVFDIFGNYGSNYYTEGSAFGYWVLNGLTRHDNNGVYNHRGYHYMWKFSDPVEIAGLGQQGYTDYFGNLIPDVYTTFKMEFNLPCNNLDFSFILDTDHVVAVPVDESATLLLFGVGLVGISILYREKHSVCR